jgi:hypothetical protein
LRVLVAGFAGLPGPFALRAPAPFASVRLAGRFASVRAEGLVFAAFFRFFFSPLGEGELAELGVVLVRFFFAMDSVLCFFTIRSEA